ncbi:MAG: hypothetical protein ACRDWT_08285 [Jatrophihabitantaceae bacterium]
MRAPAARPPWIVAAVLAVLAVVLAALLFAVVYPARHRHKDSAAAQFSSSEQAALSAATTQTINMLTYARKSFDTDFARALAGATGQLRSDLQKDKASTLTQLTTNKFDIKAQVTDTALESGDAAKGYLVLLVANGYRIDANGKQSAAIPKRIELTMVRVGGKWLASDLQGIDLS